MGKNLVCLFSKNHYSNRDFATILSSRIIYGNDNAIYEAAKNDLDNSDIYVLDEFATDFNLNRPWVSSENFYIAFVSVDDKEVDQWKK